MIVVVVIVRGARREKKRKGRRRRREEEEEGMKRGDDAQLTGRKENWCARRKRGRRDLAVFIINEAGGRIGKIRERQTGKQVEGERAKRKRNNCGRGRRRRRAAASAASCCLSPSSFIFVRKTEEA